MISEVKIENPGSLQYRDSRGMLCRAEFRLMLIRAAFESGTSFEDLADGFGRGLGTCGGDWSGIRDSSDGALDLMFARAWSSMIERSR